MTSEDLKHLEDTLWQTADTLRANSDLKSTEYSTPVLGLIFLKFADNKYSQYEQEILAEYRKLQGTRREKAISQIALEKCGFYLPEHARYDYLLNLPEDQEIDKAIKEAMASVEEYKTELKGVLPQDEYFRLTRTDKALPKQLLKNFSNIPKDATGDMFGQIYEYFLGNFALAEGQAGGEFFTPRSVVRLMVEIIEPHNGTVFDPACGSGGMFVQSAQFIERRRQELQQNGEADLFVYGQEKTLETVKLAKMNIAVNGLRGDVRQANTYYEDPFDSFERFDYVLANPPFNVDDVNLSRVEHDKRFSTYGVPRKKTKSPKKDAGMETVPNANYLWIDLFATSLKPGGRAALVMANSASDAQHSEADIRRTLIEKNLIYGMVTLPSNMFYTVTLPATLWFFDRGKQDYSVLFIDARNVFTQRDRAHREFSEEQIQNLALISRLHQGKREDFVRVIDRYFANGMKALRQHKETLQTVAVTLAEFLASNALVSTSLASTPLSERERSSSGVETSGVETDFAGRLEKIQELEQAYAAYTSTRKLEDIEAVNQQQRQLAAIFQPFFASIHAMLKVLDHKVRHLEKQQTAAKDAKAVKAELERLHYELKDVEYFFTQIAWLHERFPEAKYEDVTGLCKRASMKDIREQDYSLNAGRYVGVVIEEDGKTEEEFAAEILALNEELNALNAEARELESVINHNVGELVGCASTSLGDR
ncbi:N-6 DNA methylase [Candidatus Vecturithrix granuli]|uniref:site-specific DNA-methyltransferase (adenine-specific) n=1 Tax=Vecturithrix granuli TaxID=1499967 RepID=A0A081BUS7_VECG1|nr:N-6 DNA methylase [Candidatus Vecturithrix granuli]